MTNDYSRRQFQSRVSQAFNDNGETLNFLIGEVEQSIFGRIKICSEKDEVVKLFHILKGLREVESAIQDCINEHVKELEDNSNE